MNPLVKARFGKFAKGDAVQITGVVRGTNSNGCGSDANFHKLGDNANLWVERQQHDKELLVIECWSRTQGPDRLIGETIIHLAEFQAETEGGADVSPGGARQPADEDQPEVAGGADMLPAAEIKHQPVERSLLVRPTKKSMRKPAYL